MIDDNYKQKRYASYAFIFLFIAAFELLLLKYDWQILYFIQDHLRNGVLDIIVPIYTAIGEFKFTWLILGVILLVFKKTRKCGFLLLISLLVGLIVCNLTLKNLVARIRPCYLIDPELWNSMKLIADPAEYSFPSGHSVSSMAAAVTIFLHFKKAGIVAIVLAALMGMTRLYLFVHFPTDVFMGFIIGASIAVCVYIVYGKIKNKNKISA